MTWQTVALGEVATVERRSIQPADISRDAWYVGLEHIEPGGREISRQRVVDADLKSAKFQFVPEHILYGKLRPYLAKIATPNFDGVCSTDILPVRPGASINRSYLTHYLRQGVVVDLANSRAKGANLPRLSAAELEKLPVPLPPLDEQRRIAAILDQADVIRVKRVDVERKLSGLAQSIFSETFGAVEDWPARWRGGTIGELTTSVSYGTSLRAGEAGEWPVLRMGNVTDDATLDTSDLKYLDLPVGCVEKFTVRRGDMLFNRTNSSDKVGKACVIHTDDPFAYAGYLVRVRFKNPAFADFVATFLTSEFGRALRRRMAKSAVNQANINANEMRSIGIPIPPGNLVEGFARQLAIIRAHQEPLSRAKWMDNALFASLQSRAFKGEL